MAEPSNVLYLPQSHSGPIILKGKPGFVPEMPFRLLFKVESFNTLLIRRGQKTIRLTYIDVGQGEDRERYFCELRPVGLPSAQGDMFVLGEIRNSGPKSGGVFKVEGILNARTKDGYIFC